MRRSLTRTQPAISIIKKTRFQDSNHPSRQSWPHCTHLKKVVIGSSALRICACLKYASVLPQLSFGQFTTHSISICPEKFVHKVLKGKTYQLSYRHSPNFARHRGYLQSLSTRRFCARSTGGRESFGMGRCGIRSGFCLRISCLPVRTDLRVWE